MVVKIVDAAKIRNTVETDFSGWGTHGDYPFIPLGEFWLDKHLKQEKSLFLGLYKLERSMRGKSFRLIRETAKKKLTTEKPKLTVQKKVKRGDLTILYVDGASVRRGFDPYFILGGHDLVYPYIPKKQVWIDSCQTESEKTFSLIHEMDERARMEKGLEYANAHDFALATERMARRKDGVADFIRG